MYRSYLLTFQESNRVPISLQGSHVDVVGSGAHAICDAAARDVFIYQRSEIFIALATLVPKIVQGEESGSRHLEGSPNPMRAGIRMLHLDFQHAVLFR